MVDGINTRTVRTSIGMSPSANFSKQTFDILEYSLKITDPIDRLAKAYQEFGRGTLPKSLHALTKIHNKLEFTKLGLHVSEALASDKSSTAIVDAIFTGLGIAIGATTGLAKFHPLLAFLDVYCEALKFSVSLIKNNETFDKLLLDRQKRIDELEKLSDKVTKELNATLISEMNDAYYAGSILCFLFLTTLEKAASPDARLTAGEIILTRKAISEVTSVSRRLLQAMITARAEVELRVFIISNACAQIEELGKQYDAHIEALRSRPTLGNIISERTAESLRFSREVFNSDNGDPDTRAHHLLEKVLKQAKTLMKDAKSIEQRFNAIPVLAHARRLRSLDFS